MEMGARGAAGVADGADNLAFVDDLAGENVDFAKVSVEGFVAVAMVDYHQVAIAVDIPASEGDGAVVGCEHWYAFRQSDIQPGMTIPEKLSNVALGG